MIYLFQLVLPHVSEKQKQKKGSECLEVLLKIPTENKEGLQRAIYLSLITCITEVLLSQKTKSSLWSDGIVKKAFMYLVSMCTDRTAKVRKQAYDDLKRVLAKHSDAKFKLTSQFVVNYFDNLVMQFDKDDHREILYLLTFFMSSILTISPSFYASIIATLFTVPFHLLCHF